MGLAGSPASADPLRLAVFHTDLSRDGPGVLLSDIVSGEDPQVDAAIAVILAARADVLLLLDFDHDAGQATLRALSAEIMARGLDYPHHYAATPNSGRPTGVDLDGDGRSWRARDAVGYGLFTGDGGMALLSRHPIGTVQDFTAFAWAEMPDSAVDEVTPGTIRDTLPLHTVAAWDVEILTPEGPIHILASHATAPVFDGPEDRNGLRNAEELRFWSAYLDGWSPKDAPFAAERHAVMGTFNVDPERGEGRREAVQALIDHPALQDPVPRRPGGGVETVDWRDPTPGDLRVDYILPGAALTVTGSGVLWPGDGRQMGLDAETVAAASHHRLVWVDLSF